MLGTAVRKNTDEIAFESNMAFDLVFLAKLLNRVHIAIENFNFLRSYSTINQVSKKRPIKLFISTPLNFMKRLDTMIKLAFFKTIRKPWIVEN